MSEVENPSRLSRHTCAFCGGEFWSHRSDAKTCSNTCRQRMKRWRKRLERETSEISRKVHSVCQYLDFPESKDDAILYLQGVKKTIDYELQQRKITPLYVQQKISEEHYRLENSKGGERI